MIVDLNADIGEGFGEDDEILKSVTSANVSCGFHAGDPALIYRTVRRAIELGISVGAHPSLRDRANFGRAAYNVDTEELRSDLLYQIGAVQNITTYLGGVLAHVKPHGALYHMAEADTEVAEVICDAVLQAGPNVALIALSMGNLAAGAEGRGIRVAHEVFADRMVEPDGSLTPRSRAGAVLHDPQEVASRVIKLVRTGLVTASDGTELHLRADTVCLHGDTPGAGALARNIRQALQASGISIAPF